MKLRESINVHNKKKCSHLKKHRIILTGDSNIKSYASSLKSILSNNYEIYSIVKPESTTSALNESAKREVSQLMQDNVIIICSGTNDYEDKFSWTLYNIRNFIKSNNHTNVILMNIPFRYDLANAKFVNKKISDLNRKLLKLTNALQHTSFLKTDTDRNLFTNHGLHLNKLGKQLVHYQIASFLCHLLNRKTLLQSLSNGMKHMRMITSLMMKI